MIKKLSVNRMSISILYFLFVLYFAVTPIYNLLLSYNIIPKMYINSILMMGIFLYLLLYLINMGQLRFNFTLGGLGGLLLIWTILIQIFTVPFIGNYSSNIYSIVLKTMQSTILLAILMFASGSNIVELYYLFRKNRFVRVVTYILYILFTIAIVYGIFLNSRYSYKSFQLYHSLNENVSVLYPLIADNYAVFTMLIISWTSTRRNKVIIAIMGVILLSATLSRSSFILYVASLLVYILLSRDKKLRRNFLICCVVILLVILLSGLWQQILSNIEYNRAIYFIGYGLSGDTSYLGRQMYQNIGIKDLRNTWLFGSFMNEVKLFGAEGTYIHNWLSFWATYGLFPFLLFLLISIVGIYTITTIFRKYKNEIVDFVFIYSVFAFSSILVTRAYTWPYIWFAIAAIPKLSQYMKNTMESKI